MLLNALSNENEIVALTAMLLAGTPDKKLYRKTYLKAVGKSLAQGAIVGFAVLGVAAVALVLVSEPIDGVIEE